MPLLQVWLKMEALKADLITLNELLDFTFTAYKLCEAKRISEHLHYVVYCDLTQSLENAVEDLWGMENNILDLKNYFWFNVRKVFLHD